MSAETTPFSEQSAMSCRQIVIMFKVPQFFQTFSNDIFRYKIFKLFKLEISCFGNFTTQLENSKVINIYKKILNICGIHEQ